MGFDHYVHKIDGSLVRPEWAKHDCGLFIDKITPVPTHRIWTNAVCSKCGHPANPLFDNWCDYTVCAFGEDEEKTCDIDECKFDVKPRFWLEFVDETSEQI